MATNKTFAREDDRPFCFLFRFDVSPGFYMLGRRQPGLPGLPQHTALHNKQTDGIPSGVKHSTPGAKSGLQCRQAPLRATSTNLCPGWQGGQPRMALQRDLHSSKCRATCPFNMGAAFLLGEGIAWSGRVGEGHCPPPATLPTAGFQEPRIEYNFRGASNGPASPAAQVRTPPYLDAAVRPACCWLGQESMWHGANMYGGLGGPGPRELCETDLGPESRHQRFVAG